MRRTVHPNSLAAYHQGNTAAFTRREQEILGALALRGSQTDREIRDALGFPDMNAVRPRITELIERGVLAECGRITDACTGKTVRKVGIRQPQDRAQLSFALEGVA